VSWKEGEGGKNEENEGSSFYDHNFRLLTLHLEGAINGNKAVNASKRNQRDQYHFQTRLQGDRSGRLMLWLLFEEW
jgi:hypothetical protein